MAYFANGTEGMIYRDKYCDHCVHDVDNDCPIYLLHQLYNYEEDKREILDTLIPMKEGGVWADACKMFIKIKED